jgi:NAD(P)-dependent dehydrogenase (short-subunit alcohol dehydrogenase family)
VSPRPPRTVVTGGTRGIGAAVVRRLARIGAEAASSHEVVALGHEAGSEAPELLECLGEQAPAVRVDGCDVADPTAVAAAFSRADEDGRGLTGLVVSAGIWEPTPIEGSLAEGLDGFRRVIEVNLLGAVACAAAFLAHRRPGAPASIVLVGSTAGQRGEAGYSAYAASKAALGGLSKSWAAELGPLGVRVNVAAPGWVVTDMTARVMSDARQRRDIERATPLGRIAGPEDVAGPIAFLLSPDSAHVTGTVLSVNGGSVMGSS